MPRKFNNKICFCCHKKITSNNGRIECCKECAKVQNEIKIALYGLTKNSNLRTKYPEYYFKIDINIAKLNMEV